MKLYLIFFFIVIGFNAFSQTTDMYKRKPWENNKTLKDLPDSIKKRFKLSNKVIADSPKVRNSMPVLKLKSQRNYRGNNGRGADIYALSPDRMPCLTPDSTFRSTMPVKNYSSKQLISVQPNQAQKLLAAYLQGKVLVSRSN